MFTPTHTSLLLLPSVFPSIRVFSNELALCIRWQSIGASASASILSMNIQGWFPLGLTGLITFCPRDSQEFSPTPQFKSINLEQDGGGVGGRGVHLSMDTSGIHLQTHAEHQLRVDRSTWPAENNIQTQAKLGRMKELGEKTGVLAGLNMPLAGGETEAGVRSPHLGNCLSQRRNI